MKYESPMNKSEVFKFFNDNANSNHYQLLSKEYKIHEAEQGKGLLFIDWGELLSLIEGKDFQTSFWNTDALKVPIMLKKRDPKTALIFESIMQDFQSMDTDKVLPIAVSVDDLDIYRFKIINGSNINGFHTIYW